MVNSDRNIFIYSTQISKNGGPQNYAIHYIQGNTALGERGLLTVVERHTVSNTYREHDR